MKPSKETRVMKDAEKTPCFQLWGEDKFSHETYFCNVYMHRSSANRAKRRHEAKAKERGAGELMDSYWIKPMTLAEHLRWLREEKSQKEKTWKEIDRHKAYINRVMPEFISFLKESHHHPGACSFTLPENGESYYITSLTVEFIQQYLNQTEYELKVKMQFNNNWKAARLTTRSLSLKDGTLEEIQKMNITKHQHLPYLKDFFHETITKYFLGD